MVEDNKILERVYTVPLRRHWVNVPQYKRSRKAIVALKEFIAKHMKVLDRDFNNVRINTYLNNEIWFKGRANPPSKVKVKAIKEGNIVRVEFFDVPSVVKYAKAKHAKIHKKVAKSQLADTPADDEKKTTQSAQAKKDEVEKEKAVEQQNIKQAEVAQHAAKHTTPVKEPKINRMALKK